MQGFNQDHPRYSSTWDCARTTWRKYSIAGFYKGLVPNYLKVVPSISITFVVYEKMKKWIGA
jgi:solute carrier family 25 phosphate transporter 23/24/25/41